MAKLNFQEKQILEHVFGMRSGYVLDLSNNDFGQLILDAAGIDVYSKDYEARGTSKANRLRLLWERESARTVAKTLDVLLKREKRYPETYREPPVNERDRLECQAVLNRLSHLTEVDRLPELNVGNSHATFTQVREEVQRYIGEGRFNSGIDRLHTFVTQYLRLLVEKRTAATPSESVPLHSLMGSYIKSLQASDAPTEMSLRILKTAISTLEALNPIRNDQSLAHPNDRVIGQNEARLIFAYIIALIGYVEELERSVEPVLRDDDLPF